MFCLSLSTLVYDEFAVPLPYTFVLIEPCRRTQHCFLDQRHALDRCSVVSPARPSRDGALPNLALISLPAAIKAGTPALIDWIAETFLQLVLLSIIMVGQTKVVAAKSDRQLEQTYKDAEALLKMSDEIHCLLKQNTELTKGINQACATGRTEDPCRRYSDRAAVSLPAPPVRVRRNLSAKPGHTTFRRRFSIKSRQLTPRSSKVAASLAT